MKKQVEKSHYQFDRYMTQARWASFWYQLNEVLKTNPDSVLEIGPGPGVFKIIAKNFGINIKTLDIDPELSPDFIGSADAIPSPNKSFDVACAFQVLEHMPFEVSMKAVQEMCRVARKSVIISLPEAGNCWPNTIAIPYVRKIQFLLKNPFKKTKKHIFDGEHYWEIGKEGFLLNDIIQALKIHSSSSCKIKTFRIHENPYHRFFIIELAK